MSQLFYKATLFCLILSLTLSAQKKTNYMTRYSTIGFGAGSSHYFGDLATYRKPIRGVYKTPRWNGTVQYTRYLNQNFNVRGSFSWIRIMGDDFTFNTNLKGTKLATLDFPRFYRNLHFRNDLKELSLVGQVNLFKQYHRFASQRANVMPYFFGGAALYISDPQAKVRWPEYIGDETKESVWASLRGIQTEGQNVLGGDYSSVGVALPLGFGVRWKIKNNIDLTLEGGFRLTTTDHLDDAGGSYVANTTLASDSSPLDFTVPIPAGMIPQGIVTGQPGDKATIDILLANRSLEAFAARTGKDRSAIYNDAIGNPVNVSNGFFNPTTQKVGYDATGRFIGGVRGAGLNDSYATVQVTLHFIINPGVKCPPIN